MTHSPSTKSLRAFEAAARLGSIKAAADELHLTASAVSRRIQTLEEELGLALFVRDVQGLTLTEAGQYYAEQLRGVFSMLDHATTTVRSKERRQLTVVGPAVVVQACTDYLHRMGSDLLDIDLSFVTALIKNATDPVLAQADIAFFWGGSQWDGWHTKPITRRTHFAPLCSPDLLKSGALFSTAELAEQTWIVHQTFDEAWKLWYQALGEPMPTPKRMMKVDDAVIAGQVARNGGGVAMLSGFGSYPNFSVMAGALTPAHAFHAYAPNHDFHIGTRCKDGNPDLQRFSTWFFETVWNKDALPRWIAMQRKNAEVR
ncbi:MAG: LysR family transcriptional regulator [Proteobacteria bacterium]|nr:LysR family transcriptional regulator [Pseudomonadota bacterium]